MSERYDWDDPMGDDLELKHLMEYEQTVQPEVEETPKPKRSRKPKAVEPEPKPAWIRANAGDTYKSIAAEHYPGNDDAAAELKRHNLERPIRQGTKVFLP